VQEVLSLKLNIQTNKVVVQQVSHLFKYSDSLTN